MNPLMAFGIGGLTACTLIALAISVSHDIDERRARRELRELRERRERHEATAGYERRRRGGRHRR